MPQVDAVASLSCLVQSCRLWLFCAGDEGNISIGNNSNLQDGTLVKAGSTGLGNKPMYGMSIGSNVTVGHNATLRACTIADASLIGMDATVLEGAEVYL